MAADHDDISAHDYSLCRYWHASCVHLGFRKEALCADMHWDKDAQATHGYETGPGGPPQAGGLVQQEEHILGAALRGCQPGDVGLRLLGALRQHCAKCGVDLRQNAAHISR